jgi:F420-0:gamma-glutamyl ligase
VRTLRRIRHAAADLVGGKVAQRPVVLVRGYAWQAAPGSGAELVMEPARDLFP